MAEKIKKKVIPKEIGVSSRSPLDYDYCFWDEHKDLRFPYSINTYKNMAKNIAVASAINAIRIIALRVPRYIEPYNSSDVHIKRAKFVEECLGVESDANDMTHSFDDFLTQALSMNVYGFSVHEKVFRYRLNKYGSKYDDGKIGIKRLPIRTQDSIEDFEYDEQGRELKYVIQKQSDARSLALKKLFNNKNGLVKIPVEDTLIFKAESNPSDITGSTSPLAHIYDQWREYQKYKDLENIAASKNLNGLPVIWMPAEYMTDDAEDEMSEVYLTLKDGISKIAVGEQSSLILPSDRETMSDGAGKLFDFQLMSASSSNITAISDILQRLTNEIYQALMADVLQMGSERGGSANLASEKSSLFNMIVESRIKEIFSVLNNDLIPHLFKLNGWDETKIPRLKYGSLKEISLAEFAKAMQQTKAVNLVAMTANNLNFIAETLGLPDRVPEDATQEDINELFGIDEKMQSKSASGYGSETGGLNGSGNSVSQEDNSAGNLDNK